MGKAIKYLVLIAVLFNFRVLNLSHHQSRHIDEHSAD